MEKLKWHTEQRKVKDLKGYEHNPRQLSKAQKDQLQKSIEKFDLVEIPAINLDNTIIAGHQRVRILILLGRSDEMIDVRVPNRLLDEQEFKEYLVRSNKTTGQFNFDELANLFDSNELIDLGFTSFDLGLNVTVGDPSSDKQVSFTAKEKRCPHCGMGL